MVWLSASSARAVGSLPTTISGGSPGQPAVDSELHVAVLIGDRSALSMLPT